MRKRDAMQAECERRMDAAEYAVGGLTAAERAAFEAHWRACPSCDGEVRAFKAVVARLRAAPAAPVEILPFSRFGRSVRMRRAAVAAAVAASLAAVWLGGAWRWGFLAHRSGRRASPDPVVMARDWLAAAQETDGFWDAERWGGSPRYRIGVTGLSVLALAREPAAHAGSIRRAAEALLAAQLPSGALAPEDGDATLYNHAIALSALLRLYAQGQVPSSAEPALRRAVAFTRRRQGPAGGWGYGGGAPHGDRPNTGVSVWQIEALALVYALGWGDPGAHLRRGILWLQGQVDSAGQVAYRAAGEPAPADRPTLAAMCVHGLRSAGPALTADPGIVQAIARAEAALRGWTHLAERPDYYRDYFILSALESAESSSSRSVRQRVLEARHAGDDALRGSWAPTDAWGRAGGRVYATAMAVLAISI